MKPMQTFAINIKDIISQQKFVVNSKKELYFKIKMVKTDATCVCLCYTIYHLNRVIIKKIFGHVKVKQSLSVFVYIGCRAGALICYYCVTVIEMHYIMIHICMSVGEEHLFIQHIFQCIKGIIGSIAYSPLLSIKPRGVFRLG